MWREVIPSGLKVLYFVRFDVTLSAKPHNPQEVQTWITHTHARAHVKVKQGKLPFLQITGCIVNYFSRLWPGKGFYQILAARCFQEKITKKNKIKNIFSPSANFFSCSHISVGLKWDIYFRRHTKNYRVFHCVKGRWETRLLFGRRHALGNATSAVYRTYLSLLPYVSSFFLVSSLFRQISHFQAQVTLHPGLVTRRICQPFSPIWNFTFIFQHLIKRKFISTDCFISKFVTSSTNWPSWPQKEVFKRVGTLHGRVLCLQIKSKWQHSF